MKVFPYTLAAAAAGLHYASAITLNVNSTGMSNATRFLCPQLIVLRSIHQECLFHSRIRPHVLVFEQPIIYRDDGNRYLPITACLVLVGSGSSLGWHD